MLGADELILELACASSLATSITRLSRGVMNTWAIGAEPYGVFVARGAFSRMCSNLCVIASTDAPMRVSSICGTAVVAFRQQRQEEMLRVHLRVLVALEQSRRRAWRPVALFR